MECIIYERVIIYGKGIDECFICAKELVTSTISWYGKGLDSVVKVWVWDEVGETYGYMDIGFWL
jgi:hypothetical protein